MCAPCTKAKSCSGLGFSIPWSIGTCHPSSLSLHGFLSVFGCLYPNEAINPPPQRLLYYVRVCPDYMYDRLCAVSVSDSRTCNSNLLLKASTHLGSRQERGTLQDKSQPIRVQKGFLLNETTKIKRIIDRLTDRHHRHHRHHCRCDIIRFLDVIMHEVDVNRSHDNLKASGQVRSRGQREIKES